MHVHSNTEQHPFWNKHQSRANASVLGELSFLFQGLYFRAQISIMNILITHPQSALAVTAEIRGETERLCPSSPLLKSCLFSCPHTVQLHKAAWQWPFTQAVYCSPWWSRAATEQRQATHLGDLQATGGSRLWPFWPAKTTAGRRCLYKLYHAT